MDLTFFRAAVSPVIAIADQGSGGIGGAVTGRRPPMDLSRLIAPEGRANTLEQARTSTRPVWFDRWHSTPVYARERLPLSATVTGPAVLEQMDTTVLLLPGDRATQDSDGNLIVEVGQ